MLPLMRVVGLDEKAHTEIVHREYKNAHYLHLRSDIIKFHRNKIGKWIRGGDKI